MKLKRLLLFVAVIAVFAISMIVMNIKYDRLSRYPYKDEEACKKIDKYLNDEEIEYIIDYAIDPGYFIRYVEASDFNIYHVDTYDKVAGYYWYLSDINVVHFTEKLYSYTGGENLDSYMNLLRYYSYEEMLFYMENGDEYIPESKLSENPNIFTLKLNEKTTISCHTPEDLSMSEDLTLREAAMNAFSDALNEINETFNSKNYGGIQFAYSYLSYDELKEINKDYSNVIPGHNDHQLGLCIDLNLEKSIFMENKKYVSLKEILESHGFEISECEFSEYHIRYVGVK